MYFIQYSSTLVIQTDLQYHSNRRRKNEPSKLKKCNKIISLPYTKNEFLWNMKLCVNAPASLSSEICDLVAACPGYFLYMKRAYNTPRSAREEMGFSQ
jgi:hypothetical protein